MSMFSEPKEAPLKPSPQWVLSGHTLALENARQGLSYSSFEQRIAKRYPHWVSGSADASEFVCDLKRLVAAKPGLPVFAYSRVSGDPQKQHGNLVAAKRHFKRQLEALGCTVMGEDGEAGSGWSNQLWKRERAAAICRRAGWVLAVESPDRLLRSLDYHSKNNPSAQPTRVEWEQCMAALGGVTVGSFLPPDTPWQQVRAYQTKRGIAEKGANCGRPRKRRPGELKELRFAKSDWVRKLKFGWGDSLGEIVKETGVAKSTLRGWLKVKD